MRFWLVYLYARFITPPIVAVRKFREYLHARFFARKLWVGPRFMPDTKREKFYTRLGDALQEARAGDTIMLLAAPRETN